MCTFPLIPQRLRRFANCCAVCRAMCSQPSAAHCPSHIEKFCEAPQALRNREEKMHIALSSVETTSPLLAVLPDGKTGGKDTALSSSFGYTWSRLKRYHHACCIMQRDKEAARTYYYVLKRKTKRRIFYETIYFFQRLSFAERGEV